MHELDLHFWARQYNDWGWCVIPVSHGKKEAKIKWSRYQEARPDLGQIDSWFGRGAASNIAVVLGPASEGLACRDFDLMAEYETWSEAHPKLARTLPTVKTARGRHVYFRTGTEGITRKHLSNGELHISRSYSILPPSLHPSGKYYQWEKQPHQDGLVFIDDPLTVFGGAFTERTEENRGEQKRYWGGELDLNDENVQSAISSTLPQEFGQRHRRIFDLARLLKSNPEFAHMDPSVFRPVVKEWHRQALPNIRTKDFVETWADFLSAWTNVKYKIGEAPMDDVMRRVTERQPARFLIAEYPDNDKLQQLGSLCRELQRTRGEEPFFLSCRTAGKLLGVSHTKVAQWLTVLKGDRLLIEVSKGGTASAPRKASRFRYVGE